MHKSRLPEDRLLYEDLQGLADSQLDDWTHHRHMRSIQGHKQLCEVEVTAAGELTSWDSFIEAAASYRTSDVSLWACLIRDVSTPELAGEPPLALRPCKRFVRAGTSRMIPIADSKRDRGSSSSALDVLGLQYRPRLSLASRRAAGLDSHSAAAATAAEELGNAPAVIYLAGCYGVFALEELQSLVATPHRR